MPNIGPIELIVLLVIVLLIFGPKRLPGLGKQLGDGMRDFKDAVTSKHDDGDETPARPELTKAPAPTDVTPAPPVAVPAAPVATPITPPAPAESTRQDA